MPVIDSVLSFTEKLVNNYLYHLKARYGLECNFYYPIKKKTAYGTDDMSVTYPDVPDLTVFEVVVGIYSNRYASGLKLDNYGDGPAKIFTGKNHPAPKYSKVVITYGTHKFVYRIAKILPFYGYADSTMVVFDLSPL